MNLKGQKKKEEKLLKFLLVELYLKKGEDCDVKAKSHLVVLFWLFQTLWQVNCFPRQELTHLNLIAEKFCLVNFRFQSQQQQKKLFWGILLTFFAWFQYMLKRSQWLFRASLSLKKKGFVCYKWIVGSFFFWVVFFSFLSPYYRLKCWKDEMLLFLLQSSSVTAVCTCW